MLRNKTSREEEEVIENTNLPLRVWRATASIGGVLVI